MLKKLKELKKNMKEEGKETLFVEKSEVAELGKAGFIDLAGEPDSTGLICIQIARGRKRHG